ncbi:50S ribosomal protein L23 [bacterium]|nr:50S ribosomal protein L23 [bacterium]
MNKSPYDILVRPLITERALLAQEGGKYTFRVAIDANKTEIKNAVEKAFGVEVKSVNTVRKEGKVKRVGMRSSGRRPATKKAIITLAPGQALELS